MALLAVGCGPGNIERKSNLGLVLQPMQRSAPESLSAEQFLGELAPLPAPSLLVVYRMEGPSGLRGTLEVMARPGGFRRENWTVQVPTGDAAGSTLAEVRGTTIQTPARAWTALEGTPGRVFDAPLAGLADAYLMLPADRRAAVVDRLREWHDGLRRAREEHPGRLDVVAGQPCLQTRLAGQNLCVWEEAGLPLRYQGAEFSLVATHIDLEPGLSPNAFRLPPEAADAQACPTGERFRLDPMATLQSVAEGELALLAAVLSPGIRLPMGRCEDAET